MEYRYLGRTGIRVSPLCLGCMMFGGKNDLDTSCEMIAHAIDSGINFLDTANVYSAGESEVFTGEAIKRSGKREHLVLATKAHGNMHKDEPLNPNRWGNSRRQIIEQCDASLKRLRTDWIDLYQIHRPDPACAIDETLRALDDLVRSGKVRYIGSSTFAAWQITESLWASEKLGLNRFVTEQPPYHLLDRRLEIEVVPMAQTYSIAIIPWSPMAGGLLSGKYKRKQSPPEDARHQLDDQGKSKLLSDIIFDVLEQLEAVAKDKNCTLSQLALAWNMNQPAIVSPIMGPRTLEQLKDNLVAADITLTEEDQKRIDQIVPPKLAVSPWGEANFGPHVHRV
jgi:aryl-alcohol dehydrogenase-like predicted oxidoreductase